MNPCNIYRTFQVDQIVGPKGLTILVNNAGILQGYGFADKPNRDVVNQTLDTNITSPMMMAQVRFLKIS